MAETIDPIKWMTYGHIEGQMTSHVVPIYHDNISIRAHDISGGKCWCNFRKEIVCDECDDNSEMKRSCGKCKGQGWISVNLANDLNREVPTIVIHENTTGVDSQ